MLGSTSPVHARRPPRSRRREQRRHSFRVVPQQTGAGELMYMVVAPTGTPLYSFTELNDATAEAAELNAADETNQ